jgi:TonB family protein
MTVRPCSPVNVPRGYIARMTAARSLHRIVAPALVLVALAGCMDRDTSQKVARALQAGPPVPDEIPRMINTELPFRYPPALYAQKVQGNVTLRLRVDTNGQVRADSTRIEESSGYPALDSAAVKGSQELRFVPARLHGEPMAVTILFPVYFRHPDARPLPGDTILPRRDSTTPERP